MFWIVSFLQSNGNVRKMRKLGILEGRGSVLVILVIPSYHLNSLGIILPKILFNFGIFSLKEIGSLPDFSRR
jgi:hypothetical protein